MNFYHVECFTDWVKLLLWSLLPTQAYWSLIHHRRPTSGPVSGRLCSLEVSLCAHGLKSYYERPEWSCLGMDYAVRDVI